MNKHNLYKISWKSQNCQMASPLLICVHGGRRRRPNRFLHIDNLLRGNSNIPRRVCNVIVLTEPNTRQKLSANEPFGTPFSLIVCLVNLSRHLEAEKLFSLVSAQMRSCFELFTLNHCNPSPQRAEERKMLLGTRIAK